MQKKESNYERIILTLVALLAIAAAGWLIYMNLGFADTLTTPTPKPRNEGEPPPVAKVEEAIKRAIEVPKPWVAPIRNNKAVPLNKAVLLAIKGEEVIDMYLESTPMREPMTNAYLRENDLRWQYTNVGDLDPDEDGFSNLEEFQANTLPKDPKSHPPLTKRLFMVDRISKDYRIVLRNATGQVSMLDEPRNRATKFLEIGKVGTDPPQFFGGTGDRFKTVKFEVKKIPDERLGERDVSELTIEEIVTGRVIVLVLGVETNLAEYSVVFEFRLKQIDRLPPVGEEGMFRIPGHEDTTYKVIDIQEDQTIIAPVKADGSLGEEIVIKKG